METNGCNGFGAPKEQTVSTRTWFQWFSVHLRSTRVTNVSLMVSGHSVGEKPRYKADQPSGLGHREGEGGFIHVD